MRATAQDPPAPPPPSTGSPAEPSPSKSTAHSRRPAGFLIRGTVFDDRGLSLPGADLRIHREGEKKARWETYSNSRGEFAIRVPPGSQYEVVVRSKTFADAAQSVNAANGLDEQSLVFRMEPATRRKK